MNVDDLIAAIGYLASDLASDKTAADIQHDWKRLLQAVGEPELGKLTEQQLEDLREDAA